MEPYKNSESVKASLAKLSEALSELNTVEHQLDEKMVAYLFSRQNK
jgi:hypothetical protein